MINLGTTLTLSTFCLSRLVFRVKKLTVLKSGYFLCYKMGVEENERSSFLSMFCYRDVCVYRYRDLCICTHIEICVWSLLRIYFCILLKFTLEPQMLICCNILWCKKVEQKVKHLIQPDWQWPWNRPVGRVRAGKYLLCWWGKKTPVIICELRYYLPSLQFYWAIHSYNVLSTGFDWKRERQGECVHLLSYNLSVPKLLCIIHCGMYCR